METSGIRFENAKWAKDPEFVAIERLRFRIKLLELLRGRVVMPYVKIEGLRVNLEKDAQGQANWEFTGASPAEAAAEAILPEGRTDFPAIEQAQRAGYARGVSCRRQDAEGRADRRGDRSQR